MTTTFLFARCLDHAREAVEACRGKSRYDLDQERMLQLAVTRRLEIVGEAATRVSPGRQAASSGVPWPQVIGLRNRIVRGYDAINLDVVWSIVHDDLPPLIDEVRAIRRAISEQLANDVDRLCDHLPELQRQHPERIGEAVRS